MDVSKSGRHGRKGGRLVAYACRAAVTWTVLIALLSPSMAVAQSSRDPLLDETPMGSPLDTEGTPQANRAAAAQAAAASAAAQSATRVEPVRIEQARSGGGNSRLREEMTAAEPIRKAAPPSEYENYVSRALGHPLPRFGANLLVPGSRDFQAPPTAIVPPSYILGPGDHIFVGISGSVEGTLDLDVDNTGRVFIPKVGPVQVAGISFGNLRSALQSAIAQQYRNFNITVAVTGLRGVRVYVTGYANNPGSYTVNNLSTMVNAVLAAGGPAAGGSFRSVQLVRRNKVISDFDLYDLLLRGDKSKDIALQNEDVLYIPPVGRQVAIAGSVNSEAIYEAKPGETLAQLLGYAGGTSALADSSRAILYRLSNLDKAGGRELSRAELLATPTENGDLIQVLSTGSLARSLNKQSVVVRIEGEVERPGNYYVPPNTSLSTVLDMAGGLTSKAFVYGTMFERLSVQQQQRRSFQEAIQQLDLNLSTAPLVGGSTIDPATRAAQIAAARAALDRLRALEPDGRVILNLPPNSSNLPADLSLENSDRIYIPPVPTTVGVFGAVYRPASFLIQREGPKRVRDYLQMAGGPMRAADRGATFVVRANGEVISKKNGALEAVALPGDVIFVPVRSSNSTVWNRILQISTLVFQLGLTAATVVAVANN